MSKARRAGVTAQLDMLAALDKPNADKERFVENCIMAIKNNQYVQMKITISSLPKSLIKQYTDILSEANLTFCHVVFDLAAKTSRYRGKSLKYFTDMSVVPDSLSYYEDDDLTTVQRYLTNAHGRISGLFLANIDLTRDDKRFATIVRLMYRAKNI